MKKALLIIAVWSTFVTMHAQQVINGDLNHDDKLNVSDITEVINTVLGEKSIEYLDKGDSTFYQQDNKKIVGRWYNTDGSAITFREDGTTNYGEGCTYKYFPIQGKIVIYNNIGNAIYFYDVINTTQNQYLLKGCDSNIISKPFSNIYIVGNFNDWSWENSVSMIPVFGNESMMWRMVYIDGNGIKFNTTKAWDGSERGYASITVDPSSELGSEIQASSDGSIASSKPGWYLMILKMEIIGINIKFTVTFNKPEVRFIGLMVDGWDEGLGDPFTVPTTADGAFTAKCLKDLPGTDSDGCIRMYVKIPSFDWWKSEFIVGLEKDKISYRGVGDDQDRVGCSKDQTIYLYFSTDKGTIE